MASDDDDDGIFRVETVPPPDGESDVYNAPTKVGMLAGTLVEEIVQQARRQAEQNGGHEPIDSTKLRALEDFAAREAALRPAPVPSGNLGLDGANPTEAARAETRHDEPASSDVPAPRVPSPAAAPIAEPDAPPTPDAMATPESMAAPRPASRLGTLLLLAGVLVLLAFGIYRLRR